VCESRIVSCISYRHRIAIVSNVMFGLRMALWLEPASSATPCSLLDTASWRNCLLLSIYGVTPLKTTCRPILFENRNWISFPRMWCRYERRLLSGLPYGGATPITRYRAVYTDEENNITTFASAIASADRW
jgi:hypothetical protein